MEEIDLRQILRRLWAMVRKHRIIVLGIPIIAAFIIGVINFYVLTPVYQASTTLIIERKASESTLDPALVAARALLDDSILQQHIKDDIEIAKSRIVQKNVIKDLNLASSVTGEFDKLITVSQVKTTDLLKIEVTNEKPELAASIANTMAQEFSKAVLLDTVRIVDVAEVPDKPITPKKAQNVIFAFLVGLLGALFMVFLLEYMDNTVRTYSDIKDLLGIPLLGLISNYEMGLGKGTSVNSLITLEKTKSPISESYRSIRTNIDFMSLDSVPQKILITSSVPHEGKSITVANLAVSMAQLGKSVLVLDADLRNPSQHKLFGIDNEEGLSRALVQDRDYRDYIRETTVPGVMVLTAGPIPPNPAELVGSKQMKRLIDEASEQFDTVLIDSASVIEVTDASILAQKVDGVILILAAGKVNKDDAQTAKVHLDNVGAKILGAILNKVKI